MTQRFINLLCMGVLFCCSLTLKAQTGTVRGKVHTGDGSPVSGASVTVKNSTRGAFTTEDGSFALPLQTKSTLVISAVGYATREISATPGETLDIALNRQSQMMDEVVVTALGIRREKRQLTYSTQEVKGDVLTATKEPNVLNALTGRVSGVQVTSSTGQPGSSSRIVIRGTSSLTGDNEALIVLDGVPINNSETGAGVGPGSGSSRLSDIDPNIIESINILKGSAASALYGAKAARGVVMITTKNGNGNRKAQLNFTTQYSLETPILPEVQDKYALGDFGVYANGETVKTSTVWGPRIDTLKVNGQPVYNRNPMKDFFQNGITLTNTLSVNGGVGKSNYFFSYSYLDQKGTVPTTDLKRHTAFAKYTTAISDKFTSVFQFNYASSVNHRIPEGYDLISPIWTVYTAPFTWNPLPIYDAQGNQRVFRASRNNPYWALENAKRETRVNRFIPTFTLTYAPTDWLSVTERLGADIYADQTKYYEAPSTLVGTTGTIRDQNNNFRQFNHDLIIQANKTYGDFGVNLLVGNNVLSTYSQLYDITGSGLTIPSFTNVTNAATIVANQTYSLTRKVGFYGQANVDYKRLLNLSLTGRYDGSSVLSQDNNWYPYGSASMGFIFSELFSSRAINFGKVRVSYSAVGNDNIGAYSLTTPFSRPANFPFDGRAGFRLTSNLGNADLRNERTNEFETGLEMRFLANRIGLEASYFSRQHNDLLTSSVPISAATGFSSTTINSGNMTNKGVEVLLSGTPVKTGKFTWDVMVNYTKIKNEVTKVNAGLTNISLGQTFAFVGQPYGSFYNTGYVYNDEGRIMIDKDGLPIVSGTKIIGNLQPDWLGGLNNSFRYGNLALSFFFDMRKGGDILNSDDRYGYFYGTPKVTENREDRVIPGISTVDNKENTKVVTARSYYQRLNLIYESVIQDGTYIKLRNVNLSYNFNQKLLQRTPFASASLTATGRNLWIHAPHFTGSDPEVSTFGSTNGSQGVYGYSVPTSRSYNLTLSVTLK
ncbi:SusC/RagA family TonB-linked outer membrane protein [Segetibacter sp. 3557_3]|uniref:SusC/RagA family TonB-linked outer membrane protein n=1 Tax=Segetibacter sp. 3557_3 TaxID=2547429 RepID=UPI001058C13E|nr:SusC/RagA family TonB-linked outer membrane protein [Segetibacter sp. 3557_3]TDH28835.1 SusC/RagA family TonB-linked outer membrane protein [Segetibacter sp. 3557_3]